MNRLNSLVLVDDT